MRPYRKGDLVVLFLEGNRPYRVFEGWRGDRGVLAIKHRPQDSSTYAHHSNVSHATMSFAGPVATEEDKWTQST